MTIKITGLTGGESRERTPNQSNRTPDYNSDMFKEKAEYKDGENLAIKAAPNQNVSRAPALQCFEQL